MNRSTALVVIMVALIIVLASGLVVFTLPKTKTNTFTFTKQTVVVVGTGVVCGTTEVISEYLYTRTTVTTISPSNLPQEYNVTIVTAPTLSTYTYPMTTC